MSDQDLGDAAGRTVAASRTLQVVCLASQSWRTELPTNRQQIMARVARSGHDVLYVETEFFLGRHLLDLLRSGDRWSLLRRLIATESAAPGVRVMKAYTLLPRGHRYRFSARVNSALTAWALRRRSRRYGGATVLWLYDPCFAGCIGSSGEVFAVYDCVDNYAEQSGADPRRRALVSDCDAVAASRARLVFATARSVAERHRPRNAKTFLVPNVGDFEHFAPAADRSLVDPELAMLQRPVIGFAGNFLAQKVDFELLEILASSRPEWTIVLIGPAHEDTAVKVNRISARGNVHWLGAVPYEELPRYVAGFDVAIIPYLSNEYTAGCFPLKTFEYLAAGKPVVASGVPELDGMEPYVALVRDADAFMVAVERALSETSSSDAVSRQKLAAENTWEARANRLLELVGTEL
jgi:glycosyltransferase involved in cell wall biosynthesis